MWPMCHYDFCEARVETMNPILWQPSINFWRNNLQSLSHRDTASVNLQSHGASFRELAKCSETLLKTWVTAVLWPVDLIAAEEARMFNSTILFCWNFLRKHADIWTFYIIPQQRYLTNCWNSFSSKTRLSTLHTMHIIPTDLRKQIREKKFRKTKKLIDVSHGSCFNNGI